MGLAFGRGFLLQHKQEATLAEATKPTDEELKAQQEAAAKKAAEDAELARLQAEEDAAKAKVEADARKAEAAKRKSIPVFLDFDTWIGEERIPASPRQPVDLPVKHAKALLAEGKARRADPLPGEED